MPREIPEERGDGAPVIWREPGVTMTTAEYIAHLEAQVATWKRIAQDRCTCRQVCGDTPEDSGGICKGLTRA